MLTVPQVSSPKVGTLTMAPELANFLSLFIKDLMTLLDRQFAIELVRFHLS